MQFVLNLDHPLYQRVEVEIKREKKLEKVQGVLIVIDLIQEVKVEAEVGTKVEVEAMIDIVKKEDIEVEIEVEKVVEKEDIEVETEVETEEGKLILKNSLNNIKKFY